MCGRFTHMYSWRELHRLYSQCGVQITEPDASLFSRSYNVAPTQIVPVVRLDDAGNGYVSALKWGLVPFWASDPSIGSRMINARCEEAAAKPAYREAIKRRRCLVPASGFYEWQGVAGSKAKQPWYFSVTGEPVFSFAGLWERWEKGGEPVESFTLLTGQPNELVKPVHDPGMPCIVMPRAVRAMARSEDRGCDGAGPAARAIRRNAWPRGGYRIGWARRGITMSRWLSGRRRDPGAAFMAPWWRSRRRGKLIL